MVLAATFAYAEGKPDGVSKMESLMAAPKGMAMGNVAEDDDIIRITPDKTKIVRLNQDAASVIVTNPAHASVLLDSPRLLVVMPRVPGSTSFTVLNSKGQVILERTVIVSGLAKQKYVRIRKMCDNGGTGGCVPTSYFYCPDGCYEVLTVPPDNGAVNVPDIPASRTYTMDVEKSDAAPPPPPGSVSSGAAQTDESYKVHVTPDPKAAPANTQQAPAK